jgi:outer membrane protein assembly factor BamB
MIRGRLLLIGGNFDVVGGQQRRFLAALDRTTGQATSFAPVPDGLVLSIASGKNRIYVGTGFGDSHQHPGRYAWAFNLATGAPLKWNPRPAGPVQAIALSERQAYLGGAIAQCRANQPCQFTSR